MQLSLVVSLGSRMLQGMTGEGRKVKWLEMPVAFSGASGSVRPKYAIVGSAVVLYKEDRAYVGLPAADTAAALLTNPDVYAISPARQEYLSKSLALDLSAVEHLAKP